MWFPISFDVGNFQPLFETFFEHEQLPIWTAVLCLS